MDYGTGAIFGCPAHDQRDFEFAKKYDLNIRQVVSKNGIEDNLDEAYVEDGKLINSQFLDGLSVDEAKLKVIKKLENDKIAKSSVKFKLRDWGVSSKDIGVVQFLLFISKMELWSLFRNHHFLLNCPRILT